MCMFVYEQNEHIVNKVEICADFKELIDFLTNLIDLHLIPSLGSIVFPLE